MDLNSPLLRERMLAIAEVVKNQKKDFETISILKNLTSSDEHMLGNSEGQFAHAALDLLGIVPYAGDDRRVFLLISSKILGLAT
ncbi:hypothetical protein [Streptococcus suis]|uniref:hypothetical protein n=1 Tax=Streptococcus suis TaxID=1307 RepID=UPI000C179AE1|nr:hypothetical protein [Streptococcus suis]